MRAAILVVGGLILFAGLLALARAENLLPFGLPAGVSAGQGTALATAGMALLVLSNTIRRR